MHIYTIYRARNIINNKVYIGFDSNWPNRMNDHKYYSNRTDIGSHCNKFHRAIRKHGWKNFTWDIIYQSLEYDHTIEIMEPYFIRSHDSVKHGYNTLSGGTSWIGNKNPMKIKEVALKVTGENHYTRSPEFVETRIGSTHYHYDHTVYTWEHVKTGERCQLTRSAFKEKTNASHSNLSFYINGIKGKSIKGWKIIRQE